MPSGIDNAGKKSGVKIDFGKPVDIFSLKSDVLDTFPSHAARIKSTREALFKPEKTERVRHCPVCGLPSEKSVFKVCVYGARYHQCARCSHCFLIRKPRPGALKEFYSKNRHYASTYTSKKANRTRLEEVVRPKAEWMIRRFRALYGRPPRAVIDVGAGAGHFVYACRERGIASRGIELSEACIEFSRKNFGTELEAVDFRKKWRLFSGVDIVTFWGLIEHVPDPIRMLKIARRMLSAEGLVVVEVPRWESLSTVLQTLFPGGVVRHLDPAGHINFFTDRSLYKTFAMSGFEPVAAWYFGMDGYELAMQLSHLSHEKRLMNILKGYVTVIQNAVDREKLSDTIVLAGKAGRPVA